MTELLVFLAGWYGGWQRADRSDVVARFGRSPDDRQVRAAWIDLKGSSRWGQLTVWETGIVEVEVNDNESLDLVFSRSAEIHATEELDGLLSVLVGQVVAAGQS